MGPPYKHFSCDAAGANRYVPQEVQLQLSRGRHQPPHPGLLQVDGGSSGMRGRLERQGARYQASPPESQGRCRLSPEGPSPSQGLAWLPVHPAHQILWGALSGGETPAASPPRMGRDTGGQKGAGVVLRQDP